MAHGDTGSGRCSDLPESSAESGWAARALARPCPAPQGNTIGGLRPLPPHPAPASGPSATVWGALCLGVQGCGLLQEYGCPSLGLESPSQLED